MRLTTADIIKAFELATKFYRDELKEIGGCDHSVGICVCDIVHDADMLAELLERLKKHETEMLESESIEVGLLKLEIKQLRETAANRDRYIQQLENDFFAKD